MLTGKLAGFVENPVGAIGAQFVLDHISEAELQKPVDLDAGIWPQVGTSFRNITQKIPGKLVFTC
jgi:hypothetical protein